MYKNGLFKLAPWEFVESYNFNNAHERDWLPTSVFTNSIGDPWTFSSWIVAVTQSLGSRNAPNGVLIIF